MGQAQAESSTSTGSRATTRWPSMFSLGIWGGGEGLPSQALLRAKLRVGQFLWLLCCFKAPLSKTAQRPYLPDLYHSFSFLWVLQLFRRP